MIQNASCMACIRHKAIMIYKEMSLVSKLLSSVFEIYNVALESWYFMLCWLELQQVLPSFRLLNYDRDTRFYLDSNSVTSSRNQEITQNDWSKTPSHIKQRTVNNTAKISFFYGRLKYRFGFRCRYEELGEKIIHGKKSKLHFLHEINMINFSISQSFRSKALLSKRYCKPP